jgi:hypothetical protein
MPSWLDLGTTDMAAAESFYSGMFGWEATREDAGPDMVYSMQRIGGKDVAGIYDQFPDQKAAGMPPMWLAYITVDDVDATTANVGPAGGSVMQEPMDVMDIGRMSMIADPSGGVVALWQAKGQIGSGLSGEHGTFSWTELISTDPDSARPFLAEVLGVEIVPMPGAPGGYTMFMVDGAPAGGVMQRPDEMGEVPSHWMNYFQVDDCDASAAKATELGGAVIVPPFDTGGPGTVAVLQDAQGAVFSIIQLNPDFNPIG